MSSLYRPLEKCVCRSFARLKTFAVVHFAIVSGVFLFFVLSLSLLLSSLLLFCFWPVGPLCVFWSLTLQTPSLSKQCPLLCLSPSLLRWWWVAHLSWMLSHVSCLGLSAPSANSHTVPCTGLCSSYTWLQHPLRFHFSVSRQGFSYTLLYVATLLSVYPVHAEFLVPMSSTNKTISTWFISGSHHSAYLLSWHSHTLVVAIAVYYFEWGITAPLPLLFLLTTAQSTQ